MNSMVADPSSEKVREKPKVKKVESSGPESKMKDSLNDYISQAKEKEKKGKLICSFMLTLSIDLFCSEINCCL